MTCSYYDAAGHNFPFKSDIMKWILYFFFSFFSLVFSSFLVSKLTFYFSFFIYKSSVYTLARYCRLSSQIKYHIYFIFHYLKNIYFLFNLNGFFVFMFWRTFIQAYKDSLEVFEARMTSSRVPRFLGGQKRGGPYFMVSRGSVTRITCVSFATIAFTTYSDRISFVWRSALVSFRFTHQK